MRRLRFIRQAQVDVDGMGECFGHGKVARDGIGWCCYVQVLLDVTKSVKRCEIQFRGCLPHEAWVVRTNTR